MYVDCLYIKERKKSKFIDLPFPKDSHKVYNIAVVYLLCRLGTKFGAQQKQQQIGVVTQQHNKITISQKQTFRPKGVPEHNLFT